MKLNLRLLAVREPNINNYHDNPEHNSSDSGEGLEEPVADGGLVIRIKVELISQAVQVLNWLGGDMVKVNLKI